MPHQNVCPVAIIRSAHSFAYHYRYFLADEGTSCTAACEARGGKCDAARVTEAAQSPGGCGGVLTNLGVEFDPISGQGWLGDRSGCSFGANYNASSRQHSEEVALASFAPPNDPTVRACSQL